MVSVKERFAPDSIYTDFSIHVQLKATSAEAVLDERGRFSYSLRLDHYNKLRDSERHSALVLVVLFLPQDPDHWLVHTADGLLARRCAYWVGLRGAAESPNQTSQTVYVPSENPFSVEGLSTVLTRASRGDLIDYEP